MKKIFSLVLLFLLLVSVTISFSEDFTTFTEVDTNNVLTATTDQVIWADMTNSMNAYIYKSGTYSAIDKDFDFKVSESDPFALLAIYLLGNTLGNYLQNAAGDFIAVSFYDSADPSTPQLWLTTDTTNPPDPAAFNISYDVRYYCTLTRAGASVQLLTYSDSGRTTLINTQNAVVGSTDTYTYEYYTNAYNSGTAWGSSGEVGEIVDSITITEIEADRNFPFNSADVHDIEINAVYTGVQPSAVSIRWFDDATLTTVQISGNDWNTLTSATIGSGTITGTSLSVPRYDGWLRYELRNNDDTSITATSVNVLSVGLFADIIGQSNGHRMSVVGTGTPHANTRMYNGSYSTPTGAGLISLANTLESIFNCPVTIREYAVDASGLSQGHDLNSAGWWLSSPTEQAIYTTYKNAVAASGGKSHIVYWYNGESAAVTDQTESSYQTDEISFFAQVRSDVESAALPVLPIVNSLLATWTYVPNPVDSDEDWVAISQAKINHSALDSNIYLTSNIDQPTSDGAHFYDTGFTVMGERWAQIGAYAYGEVSYYQNPQSDTYTRRGPTETDINLIQHGGDDFTPTTGIDSYEVYTGSWVAAIGVRVDGSTIRLTHASGTVTAVRSLYGRNPSVTNIPLDNTALQLPLIQNFLIESAPLSNPDALLLLF